MGTALTRRELLSTFTLAGTAIAARLTMRTVAAQTEPSILRARTINHVGVAVSDVQRSARFYQSIFGLTALRSIGSESYALDFNGHFVGLDVQATGGRINHFGIGVDGFQPRRDVQNVRAAGFEVVSVSDEYVDVRDPDGILVRISETKYKTACAACPPPPAETAAPAGRTPLVRARTLNHVNFSVSNLQRSAVFYQRLFGLPLTLRPLLPPGSRIYGLDFNECYLSLATAPARAGTVDHFCFGVDSFNLQRDGARLRDAGLSVRGLTGGYPTVYVNDPDGLSVQIADTTWKSPCPMCDPAPAL